MFGIDFGSILMWIGIILATGIGLWLVKQILELRVVVSTNDVHIVQSASKTISYGKDQEAGNTYYAWPSWIPILGIQVIKLPMSVFDIEIKNYDGYDKGRVPFVIDIMGFFRINQSNVAAQRVASIEELKDQLEGIIQGATRSILAKSEIEEILEERAKFGLMFTEAVNEQLKEWGVTNVKNIELMDIRDAKDCQVIENIMAKKKSLIEKESRVAVADNRRIAQVAEIDASRDVQVRQQEAEQQVGQRTAEKDKAVGIAKQKADQEVKAEQKITAERDMDVRRVNDVRQAEIKRDVEVVAAEQERQVNIVKAEGEKQKTVIIADGNLEQAKRNAEGIKVEGEAKGAAETAILMAPVNSQIVLAKEIGENKEYQTYLITIRGIEKDQEVGKAQASALEKADIKVIANTGEVIGGVKNVMDLFSAKGGTALGSMVEALAQTPEGEKLLSSVTKKTPAKGNGGVVA